MSDLNQKLNRLSDLLRKMDTVAIAFSGGVDSTFLLSYAQEILGDRAFAVTASAPAFSREEMEEAHEFCKSRRIRHFRLPLPEEMIHEFSHNPPNRCYICKKAIFSRLVEFAGKEGAAWVADGTNLDDMGDYRPGLLALTELGVRSPLKEAELTKAEIRQALKDMGLPIWNKPAFACLASRIPYGQEITVEKLNAIAAVERQLHSLGFLQCRVRHHGEIARIEVLPEERMRFLQPSLMDQVNDTAREAGFSYATLDLQGYRMGSLNEGLVCDTAQGQESQ